MNPRGPYAEVGGWCCILSLLIRAPWLGGQGCGPGGQMASARVFPRSLCVNYSDDLDLNRLARLCCRVLMIS